MKHEELVERIALMLREAGYTRYELIRVSTSLWQDIYKALVRQEMEVESESAE